MIYNNKKGIGFILSFFLISILLISLIGVIIMFFNNAILDTNLGLKDYKALNQYCVEKGYGNFSDYELVTEPFYGCDYEFSKDTHKWIAQNRINETDFNAWLKTHQKDIINSDDYSYLGILDIFIFVVFIVIIGYTLYNTFKVENIGSFKKILYSVFGLPIILMASYVIYQAADWITNGLLQQIFPSFVNSLENDFPLFYGIIYNNFGVIMLSVGVLWVLALIMNYQTIADRYNAMREDMEE